jgi:hypothetical protein
MKTVKSDNVTNTWYCLAMTFLSEEENLLYVEVQKSRGRFTHCLMVLRLRVIYILTQSLNNSLKIPVFGDMAPCRFACKDRRFGENYCLQFQGALGKSPIYLQERLLDGHQNVNCLSTPALYRTFILLFATFSVRGNTIHRRLCKTVSLTKSIRFQF